LIFRIFEYSKKFQIVSSFEIIDTVSSLLLDVLESEISSIFTNEFGFENDKSAVLFSNGVFVVVIGSDIEKSGRIILICVGIIGQLLFL